MKNILITGATGNAGKAVVHYLFKKEAKHNIIAGVRNIEKARHQFENYPQLKFREFDFTNIHTFEKSLENIDSVFLLRPPQISDVSTYFQPLIDIMKKQAVKEIIFLSVQGVEKSKIIPHHKIEALVRESGIDHIFLRPGYFMQNLTTTLFNDIQQKNQIILPAGKAKFNWVDVENIAEVAAILLNEFAPYQNQACEITGYENLNFSKVVEIINKTLSTDITYKNVNPFTFYRMKKKEGVEKMKILVMIMLHFLPRFQKEPDISKFYEQLTGQKPTSLSEFVKREKDQFLI